MARHPTGQIIEDPRRPGVYGLRFRAYGKRRYQGLGKVSREEAEAALRHLLADVERGLWSPPAAAPDPVAPLEVPTFHEFASEWFAAKRDELRPKTIADYEWRLSNHLLPYFASYRVSQITVQEVDRYRQAKVRETQLLRDRGLKGGLGAESINKTLTLLSVVLDQAVEYEHIDRNPFGASPAARKRRRLRTSKPRRSYLDTAEQIGALLDAAGTLDAQAAIGNRGHRHVRRRAMLATLTFAGLRLGELLALRWRDVDLGSGRLRIAGAKTDAGVRDVHLLPALREELTELKMNAKTVRPDGLVFAAGPGRRLDGNGRAYATTGEAIGPSNLRRRVLAPAIELANTRLAKAGASPLPTGLTPHSLRRTFASVLYALEKSPPVVMAEMGHTSPALALAIYAHAMGREDGQLEALRALVNGADWAASGQPEPQIGSAGSAGTVHTLSEPRR